MTFSSIVPGGSGSGATFPASPVNGQMFYHTGLGSLMVYDGVGDYPGWYATNFNANYARLDGKRAGPFRAQSYATGAAIAGASGTRNHLSINGTSFYYRMVGAATSFRPTYTTDGLRLIWGEADNEGAGFQFTEESAGKYVAVAQTNTISWEWKFQIPDVSEIDLAMVGVKSTGLPDNTLDAPAALLTAYDDIFGINVEAGDIRAKERVGAGTGVDTDIAVTDWADGETHTIKVTVDAAGTGRAYLDGTLIHTAAAPFTAATTLTPFYHQVGGSAGYNNSWPYLEGFTMEIV